MVVSSRRFLAVGLGIVGVGVFVGSSLAQAPDAAVQRTNTQPVAPKAVMPATFGTVDMGAVFKGYEKVKVASEEFRASVTLKKNEIIKLMTEMQQEGEKLAKLTPGSIDFKKVEDRITQLKAQSEAQREQAEREFSLKEAEMLATIYKEVQAMVSRVAQWKKMTYVMRVSNDPISGADPNSTMRAIERTVVYADLTNDITNDVVFNLNRQYNAERGASTTKPTAPATSAVGISTRPAGN